MWTPHLSTTKLQNGIEKMHVKINKVLNHRLMRHQPVATENKLLTKIAFAQLPDELLRRIRFTIRLLTAALLDMDSGIPCNTSPLSECIMAPCNIG